MHILKIVMGVCWGASLSLYAMDNKVALKKYYQNMLYMKTADNKISALPIIKAQESTPLRMFIERCGVNTKNTPLAVGYTSKEIKDFRAALDKSIHNEKTADIAERFKALYLYCRCIKDSLLGDIDHVIAQRYFPRDILTPQVIARNPSIKILEEGSVKDNIKPKVHNIEISSYEDCFAWTIATHAREGHLQEYKKCQLWDMQKNVLIKEFCGLELISKLSPCSNYLIVKTLSDFDNVGELIFYDIKQNSTITLQSDTRMIREFIISAQGRFIIAKPWEHKSDTITVWEVDENNRAYKLPSNPHVSNIKADDILIHSNEIHMFVLRESEILLFDLTFPHAAPTVMTCFPIDEYPIYTLVFNDDESCIAAGREFKLMYLFNITDAANMRDLSHVFQKEEYHDVFCEYLESFNKKLLRAENKRGLFFTELTESDTKYAMNCFALRDQDYEPFFFWGDFYKTWRCEGKFSDSGNDFIAIEWENRGTYNPSVPYSLIRFALLNQEKEDIINEILKKLTTAQSIFLYSLCMALEQEEYCMYPHSLEFAVWQSFNQKQCDLFKEKFSVKIKKGPMLY